MAIILEFQRHVDLCSTVGKLKNIVVSSGGAIVDKSTGEKLNQVKYPFDKWNKEYFEEKGYECILPMKAEEIDVDTDKEQGVSQHKLDGVSTRCYITKRGLRFFGPNIVKVTDWVGEYTDKVIHLRDLEIPDYRGTILDGEFVHPCGVMPDRRSAGILNPNTHYETSWNTQLTDGWLIYVAYDVLRYRGIDVKHLPYNQRLELLDKIMYNEETKLPHHECFLPIYSVPKEGITIEGQRFTQKSLHQYIMKNNMEGTIWCRLSGKYVPNSRSKDKVKAKFKETFDVVIMGYEPPTKEVDFDKAKTEPSNWKYWINKKEVNVPVDKPCPARSKAVTKFYYYGWIGSVIFGVYDKDKKLVEVGRCSGMDEEVRKLLSSTLDKISKKFKGNKKAIGSVIEVEGQRYQGEASIRWPQFIRFRPDKTAKECTVERLMKK